jgi:predicted nucleic acid-binding protein
VTHYFLDTSAFVKAYVVEPGERRVRGLVEGATANPPVHRALLTDYTFIEATSALLQKREKRTIAESTCRAAIAEMERLLQGIDCPYAVIQTSGVAGDVPGIISRYGLRPGDAVHLAAALAARASTPLGVDFVFVSCDDNQKSAACAEGFVVWDPAE